MTLQTVVGVFAHPDDETILIGGTLAMLAERGILTHLICATRGEGGEPGEPPVVASRERLGAAREAELRRALQAVGVGGLTFLDYVDPVMDGSGDAVTLHSFTEDEITLTARLVELLPALNATVVISHGPDGEYGHPAHQTIYRAVRDAAANYLPDVLHYSAAANVPGVEDRLLNQSRTAQLVLDITPWAEQKITAMEAHVSQHALFKRRRKLQTVREALRSTESFYREHPAVNGAAPDDPFAALLLAAGARPPSSA